MFLLAACHPLDRGEVPGEGPGTDPLYDTCLFMSAVQVAPGYDWRRDTAFGVSGGSVLLYRDLEAVLNLPLSEGISPDPDTHHILDGHLYTESSARSETVVRRDGQEVARWPGRERLCGIWEADGVVCTLSQNRSGEGFSLRRNGKTVLAMESGQVVGDLLDPSFPPTGALFPEGGKACFFYTDGVASARTLYLVREERAEVLRSIPAGSVLADAKLLDGRAYSLVLGVGGGADLWIDIRPAALPPLDGLSWTEAHIYPHAEGYALAGTYLHNGKSAAGVLYPDGELTPLGGPGSVIYGDGTRFSGLDVSRKTGLGARYYFFHNGCAAYAGGQMYLVLTPRNKGEKALLSSGGRQLPLDLDGYLTGVGLSVLPAEDP